MSDEWKNSLCWNAKVTEYDALNGCKVEMSPIGRDKIDEINIFRPTTNHNMVICRAFNTEGKPIYETKAECGPNDVFDFNIGAKLALDRLYEGYDMTPKPKRKPYNGKIFVEKYPGNALKSHKIYQVCNGCIQPATIDRSPYIFEDMDDAEMSWVIHTTIYDRHATFGVLTSNMTRAYFVNE